MIEVRYYTIFTNVTIVVDTTQFICVPKFGCAAEKKMQSVLVNHQYQCSKSSKRLDILQSHWKFMFSGNAGPHINTKILGMWYVVSWS